MLYFGQGVCMTLTELIPQLKQLTYEEKFEAIEFLRKELGLPSIEESDLFYATHFGAAEAAQQLMELLKEDAKAKI